MNKKLFFLYGLLLVVAMSCKIDSHQEHLVLEEEYNLVLDFTGGSSSRAITPDHIPENELGTYRIFLSGRNNNGDSIPRQEITLTNGQYGLSILPGLWTFDAELHDTTGINAQLLAGSTKVYVGTNFLKIPLVLKPLESGSGIVNITFKLPQFVVDRLDSATGVPGTSNGGATVTVGLYGYNVETGVTATTGITQSYTVRFGGSETLPFNRQGVPKGAYRIKLSGSYTVNNASTQNVDKNYTMEWSDILYVEANRTTHKEIDVPKTILGVPSNPHHSDKANTNFRVEGSGTPTGRSSHNIFGSSYNVTPYGEGLWIDGGNWDGSSNNANHDRTYTGGDFGFTFGNEVLFIYWDGLHNADFYELELLINKVKYGEINTGWGVGQAENNTKFFNLPVSDTDWESYTTVLANNVLKMEFSGYSQSPNYYQTKADYTLTKAFTIANGSSAYTASSAHPYTATFMAWRDLVRQYPNINQTYPGAVNRYYKLASRSNDASWIGPPNADGITKFKNKDYRIGLDGNSNALAVLMHNHVTSNWYGIRLRAVNEYGYSDWIYWKGGKG